MVFPHGHRIRNYRLCLFIITVSRSEVNSWETEVPRSISWTRNVFSTILSTMMYLNGSLNLVIFSILGWGCTRQGGNTLLWRAFGHIILSEKEDVCEPNEYRKKKICNTFKRSREKAPHHFDVFRWRHWLSGSNFLLVKRMIFRMNFSRKMFRTRKGLAILGFHLFLRIIFRSSMLTVSFLTSNSNLINRSRG